MLPRFALFGLAAAVVTLQAQSGQPWKDKKVPDWTDEDAHLVMSSSPWAKSVTPEVSRPSTANSNRGPGGGGMGRRGGVGMGIPGVGGIGFPGGGGMGGGRRGGGGGGYPGGGGGYPGGGGQRRDRDGDYDESSRKSGGGPPALNLRWESALPIREAELKTRDTAAPVVDENYYAIAVYGVSRRMAGNSDRNALAKEVQKHARLRREGKKDLKPDNVRVIDRDEGPVFLFLFSKKNELTKQDRRLEFEAQIGRLKFAESFFTEDMVYDGRLEI